MICLVNSLKEEGPQGRTGRILKRGDGFKRSNSRPGLGEFWEIFGDFRGKHDKDKTLKVGRRTLKSSDEH